MNDNMPVTSSTILSKQPISDNNIQEFLQLIDDKTGNILYRKAAKYFGFKVIEVEEKVISTAQELARAFQYSLYHVFSNIYIITTVNHLILKTLMKNFRAKLEKRST